MAKSNVYTRTGDLGTTSLVGGQRVKKNCIRIEAYGTVDEFSAALGVVAAAPGVTEEIKSQLLVVQNKLFNIGGYLASESDAENPQSAWGLCEEDTAKVEVWCDYLDENTPKIRAFVLPGGSLSASYAHMARTVCRRAERRILDLAETAYVDPVVMTYFNRLSDYLFLLARHFNHLEGVAEIIWNKDM